MRGGNLGPSGSRKTVRDLEDFGGAANEVLALEFEWDPRNAAADLVKHGVSFAEAATVFGDPLGRIVTDPRHQRATRDGL